MEPAELNLMEPFFPLTAYICKECLLVQLDEFVAPDGARRYEPPVYVTSADDPGYLEYPDDWDDGYPIGTWESYAQKVPPE